MNNVKISKHTIPTYWVTALFYADYTFMLPEEIEQLNSWLAKIDPGSIVDVGEEEYPMQFEGLLHNVIDCTFCKSLNHVI